MSDKKPKNNVVSLELINQHGVFEAKFFQNGQEGVTQGMVGTLTAMNMSRKEWRDAKNKGKLLERKALEGVNGARVVAQSENQTLKLYYTEQSAGEVDPYLLCAEFTLTSEGRAVGVYLPPDEALVEQWETLQSSWARGCAHHKLSEQAWTGTDQRHQETGDQRMAKLHTQLKTIRAAWKANLRTPTGPKVLFSMVAEQNFERPPRQEKKRLWENKSTSGYRTKGHRSPKI